MAKANFKNRTLFISDNLPVLRGLNSETVDLIYLDPPFNSKKQYKAPIGTPAEGQKFDDTWRWTDLDERWLGEIDRRNEALSIVIRAARLTQGDGTAAYLTMMGIRLLELHRVLKPTGSLYLHCDPTANSYLRLSMDAVFGKRNFCNEIVWRIGWVSGFKTQKRGWIRNHDTLLYYIKTDEAKKLFNKEYIPYAPDYLRRDGKRPTGKGIPIEDTWNCSEGDRLDSLGIKSFAKKTGWATEKPLALLQRIIKASSNPGDLVLDPFAGCATCCVAAEMEGRQWIGIEACEAASDIVQIRLDEADLGALGDAAEAKGKVHIERLPPKREDLDLTDESMRGATAYRTYRTQSNMDYLYGKQRGICNGCNNHYRAKDLDFDHIIPRIADGSDELENLQLLCGHCNSTKGNGTMQDLAYRLRKQKEEQEAKRQ